MLSTALVTEHRNARPCPKYLKHTSLFQLRAAWIIPFFCYQIFDFALNTLVAVSIVVYPNTIQDYLQQLVGFFCLFFLFITKVFRGVLF